jgi:hypothetical protein
LSVIEKLYSAYDPMGRRVEGGMKIKLEIFMMVNKLGDRGLGQFVLFLHCKNEVCFTQLRKKHFRLYTKVIFYMYRAELFIKC